MTALVFSIKTKRESTEADRAALDKALPEGFVLAELLEKGSAYCSLSPAQLLPAAEVGRFDEAREIFLRVLRERSLI